jgi:hypothetical protein
MANLDGSLGKTNEQTNVLIMDFSKAFDKVSHSLLMHKLKHHGIHGKVNTCRIQNFLASRSQKAMLFIVQGESLKYSRQGQFGD